MRPVALALIALAACGYSEGGTQVDVVAEVSASATCAWSSARLTILGVELVEADTPGALRVSHGAAPGVASDVALRLNLAVEGEVPLVHLEPPPGRYAALRLRWGPAPDRGWPMVEATTGTTTVRLEDGAGERTLALVGGAAELGEDGEAIVTIGGWSCPPPTLEGLDPQPTAAWR